MRYLVYDVFTDRPFGGNQLAVIPDAEALPEDALQQIAREFNFSETTFVHPPADPANTARVRIFTPTMEIPFAGHPAIGTAVALAGLGYGAEQRLELGIGTLPCRVDGNRAEFTTPRRLERLAAPAPELVARCLSLSHAQIVQTTHPPLQASLGLAFTIVELDSRAAVSAARPDIAAIREGAEKHPAGLDFAIFCYARNDTAVFARMFAPLDNILEDPATGSASATLCALLSEELARPLSLRIEQGVDMGRPSLIRAASETEGATCTKVRISGQAVPVMRGELLVPK
jgi:trans-2,3-dihydro-3-hydroxyanthranilate isomerase